MIRLSNGRLVARPVDETVTTTRGLGDDAMGIVAVCPAEYAEVEIVEELPDSTIFVLRRTVCGLMRFPWATKEQIAANRQRLRNIEQAKKATAEARLWLTDRLGRLRARRLVEDAPEELQGVLRVLLQPEYFAGQLLCC